MSTSEEPKSGTPDPELVKLQLERANLMTELRARILNEGTKGLFLVNGGAAVALATWLQAVWDKSWAASMLRCQLWGMSAFAMGVLVAAAVPLARYLGSLHKNTLTPRKNPWWWVHVAATSASLIAFAVGAAFVVAGGFRGLPQ